MNASRLFINTVLLTTALLLGGCGLLEQSANKEPSNSGLIATPVTYYSTSRARYLGAKYKENLDRIIERIVRDPKTTNLQFANNIASVGGIGFYTHSATKTADERYLEVVLAAPETFDTNGVHSEKVNRLFDLYGVELLTILSGDNEIYQDKELSGYGLNLSWRNVIANQAGNRVTVERAIIYLSKEKTRGFLRRELTQNQLLADATIFAVEEDGPLNLISYRAPEVRQDYRPAIREDDIPPTSEAAKPLQSPPSVKTDSPVPANKKSLQPKQPVAKLAPPKPAIAVAEKANPLPRKAPVMPEMSVDPAPSISGRSAKAAASNVEAATDNLAKDAPGPVAIPAAETKEPAPVDQLRATSEAPLGAVVSAPEPAITTPAVAAVAKTEEAKASHSIQVNSNKNESPEQVAEIPEPTPEANKMPSVAPSVATRSPASQPPRLEMPESTGSTTTSEIKPMGVVGTTPVSKSSALMNLPANPPQSETLPMAAKSIVRANEAKAHPVEEAPSAPTISAATESKETTGAQPPAAVKPPPPKVEPPLPAPDPIAAKNLPKEAPLRPLPATLPPVADEAPAKAPNEQLAALVRKPSQAAPVRPAPARPTTHKPLEGFIIQLAFSDKARAQRWAEGMEKKGFAISITEAGNEGALRVRLGNFVLRDDAERQLKAMKQEGLNGIILNLPQAFVPAAQTSIP